MVQIIHLTLSSGEKNANQFRMAFGTKTPFSLQIYVWESPPDLFLAYVHNMYDCLHTISTIIVHAKCTKNRTYSLHTGERKFCILSGIHVLRKPPQQRFLAMRKLSESLRNSSSEAKSSNPTKVRISVFFRTIFREHSPILYSFSIRFVTFLG